MTWMVHSSREGWLRWTRSEDPNVTASKYEAMRLQRRVLIHPFSTLEVKEVPVCVWCRGEGGHAAWCDLSVARGKA